MKKFLAFTLAMVMALSLCACTFTTEYGDIVECLDNKDYQGAIVLIMQMAQEESGEGDTPDGITLDEAAQEAEREKKNKYDNLKRILEDFITNNYSPSIWDEENQVSLSGNDAWEYLYNGFVAMGDYEDCAQIVENFTILEDVYLGHSSVEVDNMENVSDETNSLRYYYNADGTISKVSGYTYNQLSRLYGNSGTVNIEYAADGNIAKVKLTSGDDVSAIITPTYDANGNIVSKLIKNNDGEFAVTRTYDEKGNLVSRVRTGSNDYFYRFDYTYDEKGVLVKETYTTGTEKHNSIILSTEYAYDASGKCTGKTVTDTDWGTAIDQYTYTYDNQGRLLTEEVVYGKHVFENSDDQLPDVASETITHKYGKYFVYNAE